MFPLLPEELGDSFDLEKILAFGSIPLIWQSEDVRESLEDYAQMYLREEIQAEALVRNLPAFARFLPVAAILHGQVLNISSVARDAEAHRNTIAGYIEILEDTLIAFRLEPYEANIRVKEKKHPKFYFFDSGLVRALKKNLYPVTQEERGSLFEGWFVNYVRAINDYKKLFDAMNYWSPTGSKTEVDLILTQNQETIAIEIKSGTRIRPEDFSGLEAIATLKGLKRRMIIYQGTELRNKAGIEIIPIGKFLDDRMIEDL
jgi:predicted AAA+ superfamily ATPase